MSSMDSTTPENPLLRRRNSVILPTKLNLQSSPSTTATSSASTATSSSSSSSSTNSDYELFSIKPVSYTSLRDLMPPLSTVNSPRPNNESAGGSEISIRNHLVKQAAWAYLQPMSTSPDSDGRNLFSRLFYRSPVNNPVARVIEFVDRFIFGPLTRAVDWLLRAVRIRSSR